MGKYEKTKKLVEKTTFMPHINHMTTSDESPVFEGDKRFDVKTETLGPFLKRLHKKATDQGWNNPTNAQQIVRFNVTHNSVVVVIDITNSYGCIDLTELRTQCGRFMTGAYTQHQANQNNQMMQVHQYS